MCIRRRFGVITCAQIMSKNVLTAEFATPLPDAWACMLKHCIAALPVLNRARRVIGIVNQSDLIAATAGPPVSHGIASNRVALIGDTAFACCRKFGGDPVLDPWLRPAVLVCLLDQCR